MQAFTDLVGATAVPVHGFDMAELTELTPKLDIAKAAHDMAEQASEGVMHICAPTCTAGITWTGPISTC